MSVKDILAALQLVGAATPAFKALFDSALAVFSPAEQDELKAAYAAARKRSDDAQAGFDDASKGRAG